MKALIHDNRPTICIAPIASPRACALIEPHEGPTP